MTAVNIGDIFGALKVDKMHEQSRKLHLASLVFTRPLFLFSSQQTRHFKIPAIRQL